MYRYYMVRRPAGPGAQPKAGLVKVTDLGDETYVPHIHDCAYAILEYDRELTHAEVRQYELLPDDFPDDKHYRGLIIRWNEWAFCWMIIDPNFHNDQIALVDTLEEAKAGIDEYLGKTESEGEI